MTTIQLNWKDYRWNEAIETFNSCVSSIKNPYKLDNLIHTVPVISDRLANSTWPSHRKLQS